jgi:hypothetical protein
VDAKVKVRWLKLWNDNKFDKYALRFLKSPLSDSTLDEWLSKSTYWAQLEKKLLKSFRVFFHRIVVPLQLPTDVPTLSEYTQTWKFAAFNSIFHREFRSRKVKKYNAWDEQLNIDVAMKRVLYMCNLFYTI